MGLRFPIPQPSSRLLEFAQFFSELIFFSFQLPVVYPTDLKPFSHKCPTVDPALGGSLDNAQIVYCFLHPHTSLSANLEFLVAFASQLVQFFLQQRLRQQLQVELVKFSELLVALFEFGRKLLEVLSLVFLHRFKELRFQVIN